MLREMLTRLASQDAAMEGREPKSDRLYRYWSGDEGKPRAAAMVEGILKLQKIHSRKLGAFQRLWNEERRELLQLMNGDRRSGRPRNYRIECAVDPGAGVRCGRWA